jgi:hypothetical protein
MTGLHSLIGNFSVFILTMVQTSQQSKFNFKYWTIYVVLAIICTYILFYFWKLLKDAKVQESSSITNNRFVIMDTFKN